MNVMTRFLLNFDVLEGSWSEWLSFFNSVLHNNYLNTKGLTGYTVQNNILNRLEISSEPHYFNFLILLKILVTFLK